MKNKNIFNCRDVARNVSTLCVLLLCSIFFAPKTWAIGGSGTAQDPFTIANFADMQQFKQYVETKNTSFISGDKYWKLTADINWNNGGTGNANNIIGNSSSNCFTGTFDGDGHTIRMSGINTSGYVGLFGFVSSTTIKNLMLETPYVTGTYGTGCLIGIAYYPRIDNVHVRITGDCDINSSVWGGLVGNVIDYFATITSCSVISEGEVRDQFKGSGYRGGLVGVSTIYCQDNMVTSLIFTDCMADVNFTIGSASNYSYYGGLLGQANAALVGSTTAAKLPAPPYINFSRCYSTAKMPATAYKGGLVGLCYDATYSGNIWVNYIATNTYYSNVYTNSWYAYSGGTAYYGIGVGVISNWANNANVYTNLERWKASMDYWGNSSSAAYANNVRGNETWGYDTNGRPKVSKTGYAVLVKKAGGNVNISGQRYNSGNDYYVNADEALTISPATPLGPYQRLSLNFVKDYDYSAGAANNYTAVPDQENWDNWLLTARVNGTVSATTLTFPEPVSPTADFNQWDRNLTFFWQYHNLDNLTGKYYIYKREAEPISGAWSAPEEIGSIVSGSNQNMTKVYTLAETDFNKRFEYCIAFIQGTDAAPASPNSVYERDRKTLSVNTTPELDQWSVTAQANETNIVVSFNADSRFTGSGNTAGYTYSIERSINDGAFESWTSNQPFNGSTSYSLTDNMPSSPCDSYQYRVVINAFSSSFSQVSQKAYITGSTKFVEVEPFKASKGEYANYVRLQWKVDKISGGSSETFRVFRRVANGGGVFVELETVTSSASTVYWNDNNALTGVFYEYKVTLYQVCAGNETESTSLFDIGFTQAFGTVLGRVTFGTGSPVQDVNMLVRRNDLQQGENQYSSLRSTGGGQKFEWLASDPNYFNTIWTSKKWTLQFWVYPEVTNTGTVIIGYMGGTAIYLVQVTGGYQVYTGFNAARSEIIPVNHFSHIAVTRDGDNMKIYTVKDFNPNITPISISNTAFTYATATNQTADNCKISFGHGLRGNIDEVRFWNRALTEAEIRRDYSRRLVGNESGLKGYWTFDENLPKYAFDMSREGTVYNGNHATTNQLAFAQDVPDETYQLALKGVTDANGNYQIGGIPFMGEGTSYSIVPSMGVHAFNPTEQLRYISPTSMVHNGTDFTDISSFEVSGFVTYEGGTYPVEGCSFEIDDKPLTKANGELIKTAYDGSFIISVPIGIHKVRIVKQGHTFVNDGFLKDGGGADRNYNSALDGIKFYDQTRIKFIGRVVGGQIENDKPLGFGESKNNIGAQTITLGSTRPQYNFTDVAVSKTFMHNQGQWKKRGGLNDDQTTVTYNQDNIVIQVSPVTGEFVAMVYPEPYNIGTISVPGAEGTQLTVYDNNEMLDLTPAAVPDDSYMKTSVRTWTDSTFVANRPGVVDHWEQFNVSDTVRYHEKWTYYYQSTPTFSVKQIANNEPADYFGDKTYALKDDLTGATDTLSLYSETAKTYLFGKPVFRQGTRYSFLLSAYEEYCNYASDPADTIKYPVKDGKVNMTNDIRIDPQPETLDMDENGEAVYSFLAGAPNLITGNNSFFATLSLGNISYYWDMGTEPLTAWHLGDKSSGSDFMTTGPDEITAILRDPPGSLSKSYIETGTTITTKKSNTITDGLSQSVGLTTSLGPKVKTFIGFCAGVIIESEVKFDVSAGIKTEEKWTNNEEVSTTATFTERFETSDDPLYAGHYGDVFIGNSTNILYGLTNGITILKNYANESADAFETVTQGAGKSYAIAPAVSIAYGQTFDTRFAFTEVDIEQIMIPKWKQGLSLLLQPKGTTVNTAAITAPVYVSNLLPDDPNFGKLNTDRVFGAAASSPSQFHKGPSYTIYFPNSYDMAKFKTDSVMYFNNQINGWIAVLAQNEKEKLEMTKLGNYSFGSGATIEYSKTNTASESRTSTYNFVLNPTIGIETGFEVMGIGIEIKTDFEYIHETESSTSSETETSITSGFILKEEGDDDQITVDYGMTESGTMAFKTRGGRTSCPYEGELRTKYYKPGQILDEATMQIEVPKISVISAPRVINVPANRAATYTLALQNESETGENVWFELITDESTNPNGAALKIDGGIIGNGRLFLVNAGQTLQKTLTLEKGTADTYNNIALVLRSQCQNDPTTFLPVITDTTYVSAEFIPAVSNVDITEPKNNWILNADSQTSDTLNITIANYDVNSPNFGYIRLEYRPVSSPDWNTITTFYPSSLYGNAQGTKENIGTRAAIVYPWKMPDADGAYELRATAASVNISNNAIVGNPLSTFTTDAVTGYKDVHRPVSLGAPSPANGIFGIGDELSITFNEDIQTGMLTQNNFNISGVLNAQPIAEPNVGLAFTGTQSAQTELPIFTSGSFSIETWFKRDVSKSGTLFAYGSDDNYLSLGFDSAGKAVLKIGAESYTSTTAVANDNTWKYVAMAYNRDNNTVSVYEFEGATGKVLFTAQALNATPETQGKLIVGSDVPNFLNVLNGFSGDIAQLHFYGINRTQADASADKNVTKSGREYGLIGYWSLDEGNGLIANDKARSRNLLLNNADWYVYPSGYAKQTNNSYISIPTAAYPLDTFSDFTLEFWFRSANSGQKNQTLLSADNGSIGIDANGKLTLYKADGTVNQVLTANNLTDTKWHHAAMSVRRWGSVNVYIDGASAAVFPENLLGTFASGNWYFGAKRTPPNSFSQYFAGYFDEIRIWNSALTGENILLNKNSKLNGNEPGLQAYYPFETYANQSNGLITVTASDKNMTDNGNTTAAGTAATSSTAMSVKDVRPVEDVPFTYVSSNNKIVFTLDNSYFARVEGATLNISVEDVRDMHNNKSNTEQWTAFVKRNPLLWDADPVGIMMQEGDQRTFTARIMNTGGTTVSYSIQNLPSWLTVNSSAGNLQPLASKDLTFTVYQGINIGNYETAIGLASGNGVTEILPVQVKVIGQHPDWSVNPNDFELLMSVTGQIQIEGTPQEDTDDLLAAFIGEKCVGLASPQYESSYQTCFVFMSVWGNSEDDRKNVTFKFWDASTGKIYPMVELSKNGSPFNLIFIGEDSQGMPDSPILFNVRNVVEQSIVMDNGWNWVSFNVENNNPALIDQFKINASGFASQLKNGAGQFINNSGSSWGGLVSSLAVTDAYLVKATKAATLKITGKPVNPATTPVVLSAGKWSWISYTPQFSLPVAEALAGISDAKRDDQIKGQKGYRIMSSNGWVGSLTAMESGRGYMYKSGNSQTVTFNYPSVSSMLRSERAVFEEPAVESHWKTDCHRFANTMTLTASIFMNNEEVRDGLFEIAAFSGNDCRGSAMLEYVEGFEHPFMSFLMIFGEDNEPVSFKIYDHATGNEYAANEHFDFRTDATCGTPDETYPVTFKSPTGIESIDYNIVLYPNPTEKLLYISRPQNTLDILTITDMSGRALMMEKNFSAEFINVSSFAQGVYFLKIINKGETFVYRFIKK